MNLHSIQGISVRPTGNQSGNDGGVMDLSARVHQEVIKYFPAYAKKELTDPPHADAFHAGLLQLKLRQPKAGDSADVIQKLTTENRREVYKYTTKFSIDNGRPAYKKLIDQAMALVRSRELIKKEHSTEQQPEMATLDKSLSATFAAVYGINAMSMQAFVQAMMLEDEEFEIEKEW